MGGNNSLSAFSRAPSAAYHVVRAPAKDVDYERVLSEQRFGHCFGCAPETIVRSTENGKSWTGEPSLVVASSLIHATRYMVLHGLSHVGQPLVGTWRSAVGCWNMGALGSSSMPASAACSMDSIDHTDRGLRRQGSV